MISDLTAQATFAQVVEAASFSGAARSLGLSKSAVSKQVSRLEAGLGVQLLHRTTRRLSLTEAGAVFYEGCQRMLAEAEAAEQAVTHLAAAPRGHLRLNAPMSFGILHLSPLLPDLLRRCPELTVDLTLNDRLVDLVEEGYDLAIRIGRLPDSSLIARRLAPSRAVLCAAPAYLEAQGAPAQPHDLKQHAGLLYSYQADGATWRLTGRKGTGRKGIGRKGIGREGSVRVPVAGRFQVNNGDSLRQAALGGLGIAQLPTFIVGDDLRAGRLQRVLPDWEIAAEAAVHAVYPATRTLSPEVRVVIDFLAERFGDAPYWDRGL